jgi:hypothetical protein
MTQVSRTTKYNVDTLSDGDAFEIRKCDWNRIKKKITDLKLPSSRFNWSSVLIGLSGSAGLSLLPLIFIQGVSSWIVQFFGFFMVSTLIVAFAYHKLDVKQDILISTQVKDINSEMSSIDEMHDTS